MNITFDSSNGGHTDAVLRLVNIGNNLLASGSFDHSVIIWNITSKTLLAKFNKSNGGQNGLITRICNLNNGLVASASADFTVKVINI